MKSLITASDLVIASVTIGQSTQVVLVDVAGKKDISAEDLNANIYCVDDSGVVIWQVTAPPPKMGRDSFVSLRQTDKGLRADRFFGGEFAIDVSTGAATEVGWHK
ncbi:hypothetical protein [Pandoraea sp. SD6-2]|uniref:hypothetical protein n=1 Tax=Pandoraea sp. SD6-2 TaxID=1286093 RepID=UPI001184AB92|nr:hypothetical protein [Pandoraea sp. SD6-2]